MASILRSSKFVRYIAGFAKNIVVNTPREFDGNFVNTTQCICGVLPHNFATQSALSDQNLDSSLKRIDQDVRRSGRISRRDIEDVLEEIRSTRSATSSQSLLVIRCCGNLVPEELPETRTKLVQEIWNTLNKLGIPMDISHYNALLRVYLENEHPFSPTEFLSELETKGIEPNRVTYQRLIARYCQDGDIDGATKILEFMREKQMSVNENVFNALIVGHSIAGDLDSAHGILNVMTQAGLEPSADTYTTLLCGYAIKGDIEKIMSTIQESETKEVFLLDKDYLDIAYSLAINGHEEHIPQVLTKVRKAFGYNQDAVNTILKLINKGHEEAGYLLLKTMPRGQKKEDGSPLPTGLFFIKQLVKANRPLEKIVEMCTRLEQEDMYQRGLLLATETSLQLGDENLSYALFKELHARDIEIRQHFFWPLIASKSGKNNEILNILKVMNEFNIVPNNETIREYIIPNLEGKSTEIIAVLRDGNISVGVAASSLVISLLKKNEIKEAAVIASRVKAQYMPEMIKNPLTIAFVKTRDLNSYIKLLRVVHENADRVIPSRDQNIEDESRASHVDKAEITGNFVLSLINHIKDQLDAVESVLEKLVEYGLPISSSTAQKIEEKLGEKMSEKISDLLGKLTSGELTPVPLEKQPLMYVPSHQMNIPQLERLIQNLKSKNQEVKGLNRHLLTLYYRAKDLEKVEALLEQVKEDASFVFTNGVYAQLLDLYAHHGNLEKSLEYYEKIKSNSHEQFAIDDSKIIRLADLLMKNDRFDDGIELLENTPREKRNEDSNFSFASLVWRFLNSLAEKGAMEQLEKVFEVLTKKGYVEVNNVLLGPLIKVHLVNNDIDGALNKFEWCVNQFKATPWKNELARQLIQSEDAEKLQKLTDLSTAVHGEVNSLYDLVFAFVEQGRVRQARKILETPGLQSRPQRINMVCERYQQEGLIQPLEGLKDATKDLNHIDRTDIYYQLLLSYIKQGETEKALGLWTQMQEEDLAPTDQFLLALGNHLKSKGQNVPFVLPEVIKDRPQAISLLSIFKQKLKSGDLDEALDIKKRSKENFSVTDLSSLIEKLVQFERLTDASKVTMDLLNRGNMPLNRVFRFLLNKLAVAGDVETLTKIGSKLNPEHKKIVSFDNRLCHANLVAGKGQEYLDMLNEKIEKADEQTLAMVAEEFPRGGAYGLLQNQPELLEQYESVAKKYSSKGIIAPLNVLWTYYFINGRDDKTEEIWTNYLKDSQRIMFQKIVHTARDKQDENLTRKLIEHLKISKVTPGAMGNAYSCLIDVLVTKGKDDEVVKVFEEAAQNVTTQYLNRTAVLRAKSVFEKLQKPFNYTVPLRKPNQDVIEVEG